MGAGAQADACEKSQASKHDAAESDTQPAGEAAPEGDRALWATAFYAGLRRGELQALAWSDVDLAHGLITVERSWDQKQGLVEPKSAAGRRRVPIAGVLRDYLVRHRLNNPSATRVFGRSDGTPFSPSTIAQRTERAWAEQGLNAVTLHECRHTFAALMIAAGVSARALQTFMGQRLDHGRARPLRTCLPGRRAGGRRPPRCLSGRIRREGAERSKSRPVGKTAPAKSGSKRP